MTAILETDRLILRPFELDDVENLVSLDADPEVMRFINGGEPTPRDEVEYAITRDQWAEQAISRRRRTRRGCSR